MCVSFPVQPSSPPLLFEHYPISHSLLAAIAWAALVAGSYLLLRHQRIAAVVIGGLVVSHWALDAIVHRPDLPLFPGSDRFVGLNAWSSLPLTLVIEVPLFFIGVWLYARITASRDAVGRWGLAALVVVLLGIYAANMVGPPPPGASAIAWAAQLQWLLVLLAYWIDGHRSPKG
jgi:membrane-bound metal-dependent hydrolase YbcI (DUF457 family)